MGKQLPPGRIVGKVICEADQQPVPEASIRIVVDGVIVDAKMTNVQGGFNSRLLFSGRYRVEAECVGLHGAVDDVEVQLGEITQVTVAVR